MSGSRIISAFGLVILCQISSILSSDVVPVLLFGGETSDLPNSVNPLRKMSENEFADVLASKIVGGSKSHNETPPFLVFVKENFCVEDLTQQELHLDSLDSLNYFPAVDSPLSTFSNLESYNVSRDEKPGTVPDGHVAIVTILDISEAPKIYEDLRSNNHKLLGAITGLSCSYSRSERTRRAIAPRADSEVITYVDRILLYSSSGIYLKTADSTEFVLLGAPTSSATVANGTNSIRLDLGFSSVNTTVSDVTLRLQFSVQSAGYWSFENVEYEANSTTMTLLSNTTIFFPFNFSYHCSLNSVFFHNDTYLNFTDIQVQVDPTATNTSVVFSDGYDCVGFTTIPIWTGIFVTAILALIMIWALTMILDIRTMDRFDDPKGKTITIAASE